MPWTKLQIQELDAAARNISKAASSYNNIATRRTAIYALWKCGIEEMRSNGNVIQEFKIEITIRLDRDGPYPLIERHHISICFDGKNGGWRSFTFMPQYQLPKEFLPTRWDLISEEIE